MDALSWGAVIIGAAVIWSAITGRSPIAEVRAALSGTAPPSRRPPVAPPVTADPTGGGTATSLATVAGAGAAPGDPAPSPHAAEAVAAARALLGHSYVSVGGCAGLTSQCWNRVAGLHLTNYSYQQYEATAGTHVPYERALPGDLVFFPGAVPKGPEHIGHVGMIIGPGQMIEAPGHSTPVRIHAVYSDHFPVVGRPDGRTAALAPPVGVAPDTGAANPNGAGVPAPLGAGTVIL